MGKGRQAIMVALIALAGTLAAALIGIIPRLLPRKEPLAPSPNPLNINGSTIEGSVVGGNQNITFNFNISSNADVDHFRAVFTALQTDAKKKRESLSKQADQTLKQTAVALGGTAKHSASGEPAVTEPSLETGEEPASPLETVLETRASELTQLGYYFSPTNSDFSVDHKSVFTVSVPVAEGLEYVIVAVGSPTIGALREYIFDETGEAVTADLNKTGYQGFYSFRAKFTGAAQVFFEADQVQSPSQILCMVGRRGEEEPRQQSNTEEMGVEPTFEMQSTSPAKPPSNLRRKKPNE
jgi:hypothetical protein